MIFYTYFDINYLCRGIAMYQSLLRFEQEFELYVLCLDNETYRVINEKAYPNLIPVQLTTLEQHDPALKSVKPSRTKVEYYFSCTAAFSVYLFENYPDLDFITYLDADTYFFDSPKAIVEKLQTYSIAITPHRFPKHKVESARYGIYNVGWVSFKRDTHGLACLKAWREDCLAWCFNRLEGEKFGDQKYLDKWPGQYDNLHVIEHQGVNAAPWNLEGAQVHLIEGQLYINDDPLILYHFHNFHRILGSLYQFGLREYAVEINGLIKTAMYQPYAEALRAIAKALAADNAGFPHRGMKRRALSRHALLQIKDMVIL